MRLHFSLRKILSVIATIATLANSLGAPVTVLAQEITPEPTPFASPEPTAEAGTPTAEPTIAPTESPTATPDATPDLFTATPEVTIEPSPLATDLVTPNSDSIQPETQGTTSENTQPQAPPSETTNATPTATPETPVEHGNISTTTIENVDLTQVTQLNANVDGNSNIVTDKPDYAPTDVVLITGTGFTADKEYTIHIVSTDEPQVDFKDQIKADSSGSFEYAYQLDGTMRPNYAVYVKTGEIVVASTTFTDSGLPSSTKLNQWKTLPSGSWITGALNSINSNYSEGETIPFELDMGKLNTSGNPYTFSVCRDYQSGTHFGYVSLQPYNTSRPATPDDSISTTNSPFSGSNITTIAFTELAAQGACSTGQRETQLSITVTDSTINTYLLWGGKLAAPGQDSVTIGNGASSYPGGSLHMHLLSPNKDVGIQTNAIIASPTITTTPIPTSGNFGTTLNDSAVLTNANSPTGTITFYLYSPSDPTCSGSPVYTQTVNVTNSGASTSGGYVSNAVGTWHWTASYSGDALNDPTSDSCTAEPVIISALSPTIATTLSTSSVGIGVNMHDSAALTGATGNAGGTVTYHAYAGANTCTGTDLLNSQVTVTNGVIPNSANISFSSAGTYSFQAVYSGDSNNNGATSICSTEQLVVNLNSPTIATTLSATSVDVGSQVHDSATLTGATSNAGGSVTYTAYTNNLCTLGAQSGGTKTVTNGVVPDSNNITFNTAGDYYWQAVYSGDSNNNGATSTCADEHLVVNKVTPTISTTPNPSSGNIGAILNDTATVSGGYNPTGSVTFKLFPPSDATCRGTASYTYTDTTAPYGTTPGFTSNVAGTWHWTADYLGDTNNNPVSSACADEAVTLGKLTSNTVTTIYNSQDSPVTSIDAGLSVYDSATVSGSGPTPTGNVDFTFFTNASCEGQGTSAGTGVALVSGVASPSSTQGPLNAGGYSFKAHYNGDGYYEPSDGACEPLTVNQVTPEISTIPSPSPSAVLGATLNDSATLSGGYSLTGTLTFKLYGPSDATCSGTPAYTNDPVSVIGEGTYYTSPGFAALAAGVWRWVASYSGDINNNSAVSGCQEEQVTVDKASLGITTEIHNSDGDTVVAGPVALGSTLHDSATVSGIVAGVDPTNPVTFKFFANNECTGDGTAIGSVTLSGNVAHPSTDVGPLNTGTYSFNASIAGDSNYNGATSACEPFTVSQSPTTVTTQVHDTGHNDITNSSVALGADVHDSATVSGQIGNIVPTGTITYNFFDNGVCRDTPLTSESVNIGQESSVKSGLGAGNYSYLAVYSGDNNYSGDTGDCEPLTVSKADSSITTEVHNPNHQDITFGDVEAGTDIHDSASVQSANDSFDLTGSVDYHFFTNGDCSGDPVTSETVGIGQESSTKSGLGTGNYSFLANYSGDDNYNAAFGTCEPFTIYTKGIEIAKSNDKSGGASKGDTVNYTLVVTNTGGVDIDNVVVTDVLPGGFSYIDSSAQVDGTPQNPGISGNTLSWNIGTVTPGSPVTITYQAKIASDVSDGTYINFATCQGTVGGIQNTISELVLDRLIRLPEPINCNTADSSVPIGSGISFGGKLGQVLGISTELPATGSPTGIALIAIGLIGVGFILKKKYAKN